MTRWPSCSGWAIPAALGLTHWRCIGNPRAVPFAFSQIKTKLHLAGKAPRTKAAKTAPIADLDPHFLFSFSGIKTAVLRYVELHDLRPEAEARREALFTGADAPARPTVEDALAACDPQTLDLIASFQHAVVGDLLKKTFAAAEALGAQAHPGDGRGGCQPRAAGAVYGGGNRPLDRRGVSDAGAFDRQCGHDCRRRLASFSGGRLRQPGALGGPIFGAGLICLLFCGSTVVE